MIEDKYIDFFIGGNINEPAAIEIPLKRVNPDQLVIFLRKYGLDIDTTGARPDKISVTKTTMRFGEPYCSVITPALTPNDLKKTYRILETLLDKYIEKGTAKNGFLQPLLLSYSQDRSGSLTVLPRCQTSQEL